MRFTEIKISNYRQYKDIDFVFEKKSNYDMHVIIASNGVGKTNLLNSINWCLYGDEPHSSGTVSADKKDKLPVANISAIEEAKEKGEKQIEVCVSIKAEEKKKYEFERKIKVNVATGIQVGKDEFLIKITNEDADVSFAENDSARELVDRHLPQRIREYFYFDGDQLFNYFDYEPKKLSHVKDSIYEIAQVNIVESVNNHLETLEKEYMAESSSKSGSLEVLEKQLNTLEFNIKGKKEEIEKLDDQIAQSEREIEKLNSYLNGTESVVEDNKRFEDNRLEIERCEEQLEKKHKELCELIRKYILKIFMYRINKRTSDYIEAREAEGEYNLDASIDIIKKSIEEEECALCRSKLDNNMMDNLSKLLKKISSNTSIQKLAEIKSEVNYSLDIVKYKDEKEELFDEINEIEGRKQQREEENNRLYGKLTAAGNIDEIDVAVRQKEANRVTRDRNLQLVGSYIEQLKLLEQKCKDTKEDYQKALSENEECRQIKKKYEFVCEAREIVQEIETEIINDVKERMQCLTMERFNDLIWKKDTYGHIEMDDKFKLKLYHKVTKQSCLNSCSGAEKELLALAFTLALHDVSGYDNLLFIDSPVGRVSDVNRANFAEVLLGVSQSKQIILAFTPSEYSDEISSVFDKKVLSSYNILSTDEKSTVQEGL